MGLDHIALRVSNANVNKVQILMALASELLPEEQRGVSAFGRAFPTLDRCYLRTVSAATNDHDDHPLFGRIMDEKETVMDGGSRGIRRDGRRRCVLAGG
jgi:hypothetical protein